MPNITIAFFTAAMTSSQTDSLILGLAVAEEENEERDVATVVVWLLTSFSRSRYYSSSRLHAPMPTDNLLRFSTFDFFN